MKFCIIQNPKSGPKNISEVINKVSEYFINKNHQMIIFPTKAAGDATSFAEKSVHEKFDLVIVAGGDGTINEVCNGLANSEIAMGVLPTGTANVFAKEIGLPSFNLAKSDEIIKAIENLIDGRAHKIDLGKITFENGSSRYFTMWCGIGLDAAIMKAKKSPPDHRFGRLFNYSRWAWDSLKIAGKYKGVEASIKLDDKIQKEKVLMIIASNSRLYAKYLTLSNDAQLDDGMLHVVILKGNGLIQTSKHTLRSITNRKVNSDFSSIRTKKMKVSTKIPLLVHVDAETIGTTPIEVEIIPSALKIKTPIPN